MVRSAYFPAGYFRMQSLVDRSLKVWTQDCDAIQSRIAIFEHVRNIPYSLNPLMNNPAKAPEQILVAGKGSCGPKHYLLAEMYRRLGLEVTFVIVPFLWNDPDIMYPQNLRRLAEALPVAHHLACRVRIRNRDVLVDATWDPSLKLAGFTVNEAWDGWSDLECAVKPLPQMQDPAFSGDWRTGGQQDFMSRVRFFREFDAWLWNVRKQFPGQ